MVHHNIKTCIAVVCFLFCLGYAQAQSCLTPPSGLLAWYPGDGNANDLLGTNNGAAQNGTSFAPGKVGMAFNFNGINQFVALPADFLAYPVTGVASSAPVSVDAWFQTTTGGVILSQQGGLGAPNPPTGWVPVVYVGTDGMLYAEFFWGAATATPVSSSPKKVNDGAFHHVALTYDGTTQSVYLDGVLLVSGPFTQTGYAANYHYQIGTGYTAQLPAGNGGYYYFQGLIDEVEFFGRALSAAEIQAIYNAGSAGRCKDVNPRTCTVPPSGMTAWYTGDGDAEDWLGLHDAAFENASFAAGKVGQAFSFNGTSQFVALPANFLPYPAPGATSDSRISVDAWFQTSTAGAILGQQGNLAPPATPNGAVPAIYVGTDGYLYARLFSGGTTAPISSAPRKVNDGVFHHVAVTYDGTTEKLYLDGTLAGSATVTQTGYADAYHYQIGTAYVPPNWPATNIGYFYFKGLVDEMHFFSRALSATEVQSVFAAGIAGSCRNLAPVAKCKNVTVAAGASGTAEASIDNGSFSPVGKAITLTQAPLGPYALGERLVTLTVTDIDKLSSQCTGTVKVVPETASPCGFMTAAPNVLWPPNNKMVSVKVTFGDSDNCPAGACKIFSVSSNEADDDDDSDWEVTGDRMVNLRASRNGNGSGRVYTILLECAGSENALPVKVTVPHDQGIGKGPK